MLAGAAVLPAGCGSDDGGGGGGGGETDRAQYIARADQKCEEAAADLQALTDEARDPEVVDEGADRLDELAQDLEEAGPPPDDAAAVGAIGDGLRKMADQLRVLANVQRFGRPRRAREAIAELQSAAGDVARRTSSFGFQECEALTEFP